MNFEDLTPQEQAEYLGFMLLLRPLLGNQENIYLWINYLTTLWIDTVQPIHNQLLGTAEIPDNTGYPNSTEVLASEVDDMIAWLQNVYTFSTAANSSLATKAVGPENIIVNPGL